ncbi:Di-copper centre-containing protein [Xylariomycetidae sp. FL2044]|nr:Di-copper centre-containing protein [Xylariomycetidae sp. FL2044]
MFTSLTLALGALPLIAAIQTPYVRTDADCTTRTQRKSWSALTDDEKRDYLNADLCLMAAPPRSGIPGAVNRWEELQYAHIAQSDYIHGVGAFLPFHRYFVTAHEHLLRTECNYTGPLPYWDEPSDVGDIAGSDLWDAELGFGGNGTGTDLCIADGPFANLTLHYTEDLSSTSTYCISRYLNDRSFSSAAQPNVDLCMSKTNYLDAWRCLEGLPHGAGHGGVMGVMVNPLLSPGDPVFYLHHGYLDKLWWDWQSGDLETRLDAIAGNNTAGDFGFGGGGGFGFNFTGPPTGFPGPGLGGGNGTWNFTAPPGFPPSNGSFPFPGLNRTLNKAFTDYFNDGGNTTTLNHTLWSANILENVTIADVMDIRGGFVCAEFA